MGRTDSKLPPNRKTGDLNHERYIYVLACLVGQTVTVQLKNNTCISGIFHSGMLVPISSVNQSSATPSTGDITVILKCARELPSGEQLSGDIENTIIIEGKDLVSLSAAKCPLEFQDIPMRQEGGTFKSDAEISNAHRCADLTRDLERWEPSGDVPVGGVLEMGLEDTKGAQLATTWDQFEVNARRFQVKSTYQEELYTTPLDIAAIPQAIKEKAEQIARDIEASQHGHNSDVENDDEDEEALYGAVQGTGAYATNVTSTTSMQQSTTATAQTSITNTPALGSSQPSTSISRNTVNASLTAEKECLSTSVIATSKKLLTDQLWRSTLARGGLPSDLRLAKATVALLPKKLAGRAPLIRGASRPALLALQTRMFNQSLVKNINALNLEPALPRLDDGDTLSKPNALAAKVARAKGVLAPIDRNQEKKKFLESLKTINSRMDRIDWKTVAMNRQKNALKSQRQQDADALTPSAIRDDKRIEEDGKKIGLLRSPETQHNSNLPHKNDSGNHLKRFLPFEGPLRHREPIDQILMNVVLPKILSENPQTVHPAWNARIDPNVPRPLHYSDILGSSVAQRSRPIVDRIQPQEHHQRTSNLPHIRTGTSAGDTNTTGILSTPGVNKTLGSDLPTGGNPTMSARNSTHFQRTSSTGSTSAIQPQQQRNNGPKDVLPSGVSAVSSTPVAPSPNYHPAEHQQHPFVVPIQTAAFAAAPAPIAFHHPSAVANNTNSNNNLYLISKSGPGVPNPSGFAFVDEGHLVSNNPAGHLQAVGMSPYGHPGSTGPYGVPFSGPPLTTAASLDPNSAANANNNDNNNNSGHMQPIPDNRATAGGHFVGMPGSANIVFIPPGTFLTAPLSGGGPPCASTAQGLYGAPSQQLMHPVQWHLIAPPTGPHGALPNANESGENPPPMALGMDPTKMIMMVNPSNVFSRTQPPTNAANSPHPQFQPNTGSPQQVVGPTPQYTYQFYHHQQQQRSIPPHQQTAAMQFGGAQHVPYLGQQLAPVLTAAGNLQPQVTYVAAAPHPGVPQQTSQYQKIPGYVGTPSMISQTPISGGAGQNYNSATKPMAG